MLGFLKMKDRKSRIEMRCTSAHGDECRFTIDLVARGRTEAVADLERMITDEVAVHFENQVMRPSAEDAIKAIAEARPQIDMWARTRRGIASWSCELEEGSFMLTLDRDELVRQGRAVADEAYAALDEAKRLHPAAFDAGSTSLSSSDLQIRSRAEELKRSLEEGNAAGVAQAQARLYEALGGGADGDEAVHG